MPPPPHIRARLGNSAETRPQGKFILYWMSHFRRPFHNFALQRAALWAQDLEKPLLIVESLACGGRWDTLRSHRFVLDGMLDNARRFAKSPAAYFAAIEKAPGELEPLCAALADEACVIAADSFPDCPPSALSLTLPQLAPARLEWVDSNGLLPLSAPDKIFVTAAHFRRYLQRHLPPFLADPPLPNPLAGIRIPPLEQVPLPLARMRANQKPEDYLSGINLLSTPLDHAVIPTDRRGGWQAAEKALREFLKNRLSRYAADRNHPDRCATSELSPYLHHGHISSHQVFQELMDSEGWTPARLALKPTGSREGWWGASPSAEAFLDQLITWRELGYNMCARRPDTHLYESLPPWAIQTLERHARDPRPYLYSLEQFEQAATHDPLWNAAQNQLRRTGLIHNYLRMLWGKKILEWSASPREALEIMLHLNNKYALDGRNPNSLSGIFWVLGRYDHPWPPERLVTGTSRPMSSERTAKKVRLAAYLKEYGDA